MIVVGRMMEASLLNNNLKLVYAVWQLVRLPMLRTLLIIVTMVLLPVRSIVTLMLSTIVWVLVFDLFQNKPTLRKWFRMIATSVVFFLVIGLVYYFLGLWGVGMVAAGGAVIMLGFAAYTIIANWKVYDSVTTWGAKRIRGETKEDYNLDEVLKK